MSDIKISWHNEYSKTVDYAQLAQVIVQVYYNGYEEIPTIEDLKDFIWGNEYIYDYTDEILKQLFPYDVDINCSRTEIAILNIRNKDEFCKWLKIAIENLIRYKSYNK